MRLKGLMQRAIALRHEVLANLLRGVVVAGHIPQLIFCEKKVSVSVTDAANYNQCVFEKWNDGDSA